MLVLPFGVETWAKVGIAALLGASIVQLLRWTGTGGGPIEEIATGTSNKPIARGPASDPKVAEWLREYGDYLRSQGVNTAWFPPEDLTYLRRWKVHAIPPRHRWDEMARTLRHVVQPLRAKYGKMRIKNGYRPRAYNEQDPLAAGNSRHIWNQAIDFQFTDASGAQRRQAALDLANLYKDKGKELKLGLGIYSAPTPRTFHVDTGWSRRNWKKTKHYLKQV